MIKRIGFRLFCLMVLSVTVAGQAHAARTFRVSNYLIGSNVLFEPPSCDFLITRMGTFYGKDGVCEGMDAALKAGGGSFIFRSATAGAATISVGTQGSCKAGTAGSPVRVASGYVNAAGDVVQEIPSPSSAGVQQGCEMAIAGVTDCSRPSDGSPVSPGVYLAYCSYGTVETGANGGASAGPDTSVPPYTGGGTDTGGGGGTNPGGGTDPGDGGTTPGGGTPSNPGGGGGGGGTTPGDGGGTTPGGGGTTPGDGTGGGTTPGGGTGGGGSGTDFCEKHPGSSICQNSGVSGNCENFVCNGDAIQCAILRETHDANCKIAADDVAADGSAIGKLGKGVLGGNDPDGDKLPHPGNGTKISIPALDQSGWLGGGECFADKTVYMQGREIVIPFSKACSALIVLRYAIMIVAALASFKMLSGAIIRE